MNTTYWYGVNLVGYLMIGWCVLKHWKCFRDSEAAEQQDATPARTQRQEGVTNVINKEEREKEISEHLIVRKLTRGECEVFADTATETNSPSSCEETAIQVLDSNNNIGSVTVIEHSSQMKDRSSLVMEDIDSTASIDNHMDSSILQVECSICLANYQEGDLVACNKSSNCKHVFHSDCLTKWLMLRNDCPICRVSFFETGSPITKEEVEDRV